METWNTLKSILDIAIVAFIIYKMIRVVHGTKAMEIVKGTLVVLLVWVISGALGLQTLKFILSQVILYGILGLMIIFQPELRNALERLGRQNLFKKNTIIKLEEKVIEDIVEAVEYMSKRRIGALMSIEMNDSLKEYSDTGIPLKAEISKELIENIFTPNVPLHDGAVIIRNGKIESASCYLPLSESTTIPKELGTRHRAAIGLSEVCDGVTIVVSEETGGISLTKNNKLYRKLSKEELKNHLEMVLLIETKREIKKEETGRQSSRSDKHE